MKLSIGSDHAGFALKEHLKKYLENSGYDVEDKGTHNTDSTDYPIYAHEVAESVETGDTSLGILICGSGNGVAMSANKHQGIRCALCWTEEITALARAHNDANVLALPARFIDEADAERMVKSFLNTAFEGGRHGRRVAGITRSGKPENKDIAL